MNPNPPTVEILDRNNRGRLRLLVNDSITVTITKHAEKRAEERNIDLIERIKRLSGVPTYRWYRLGVIAVWHRYQKHIKVITVWDPR